MNFPYYEIQLSPRKLKSGKYKATCNIFEQTGDGVKTIQTRWKINGTFETKDAANTIMRFQAIHFLKREYGLDDNDVESGKVMVQ
ncbi:MAG: hypothetical protein ACMG6E_04215 [Candidatus Roizmanbacteria bacterium]